MGKGDSRSESALQRKGPWTAEEDQLLANYIRAHGEGVWKSLPHRAGLLRCGKSCRLRWMNYLRPNIRRGNITPQEEDIIIRMHALLGNRWSLIAGRLPGRTDNEIKNHWNTHLSKRIKIQKLPFRHRKDDNKNNEESGAHAIDHGRGNKPEYKKFLCKENVKNSKRVKMFTPKPIRIAPSRSVTEVFSPKPIRVTASSLLNHIEPANHANNITSDIGNFNNNPGEGGGENSKFVKDYLAWLNNFIVSEDGVKERNLCHEICTDCLGIHDDKCKQVQYQEKTTSLTNSAEARTLEMVYEEYSQLLNEENVSNSVDSSYK